MLVNWDDYSQYMESHKSYVPNHQPDKLNTKKEGKTQPQISAHFVMVRLKGAARSQKSSGISQVGVSSPQLLQPGFEMVFPYPYAPCMEYLPTFRLFMR